MSFPTTPKSVLSSTSEPSESVPQPEFKDPNKSQYAKSSNRTSGAATVASLEAKPWAHFVAGA